MAEAQIVNTDEVTTGSEPEVYNIDFNLFKDSNPASYGQLADSEISQLLPLKAVDISENHVDLFVAEAKKSLRQWLPDTLFPYSDVVEVVVRLVTVFFPRKELVEFVQAELLHRYQHVQDLECLTEQIFTVVCEYVSIMNFEWKNRLTCIFEGSYPEMSREVWSDGGLHCLKYGKAAKTTEKNYTFFAEIKEPIGKPGKLIAQRVAPSLYNTEVNKKGVLEAVSTVEAIRFLNGDRKAVRYSALCEEVVYNRPAYRQSTRWEPYSSNRLPRKVIAVKNAASRFDKELLGVFKTDLLSAIAWGCKGDFANYCGYIMQPLLAHIFPGQMPIYDFSGPTKSGKGFLSSVLPKLIYNRPGKSTVAASKIFKNDYELALFLGEHRDAIFICFDEIKNATDEDLKSIDAFATQEEIPIRKMRYGYSSVENNYVLSLSCVKRMYSDETVGRLASIKLAESRPDAIQEFYEKYKNKGSELLAAILSEVNAVDFDISNLPKVSDRRTGFRLMHHFIESIFGVKPDYSIDANSNDLLDDIAMMHEREKGKTPGFYKDWSQYSPRAVGAFLESSYGIKLQKDALIATLNSSLGYLSTRKHPVYKDTGYPAESGAYYHIELREEGKQYKRTWIYVKWVSSGKIKISEAMLGDKPHPLALHTQNKAADSIVVNEKTLLSESQPECFGDVNEFDQAKDKCFRCDFDSKCFSQIQIKKKSLAAKSVSENSAIL